MALAQAQPVTIPLGDGGSISGLLDAPAAPDAGYVFAHGAGAGMHHAFMAALATGLAARGIAVLRYQFPYMERGSRRPDSPSVAQSAVRAAVAEARRRLAGIPLFAGGKSFGARMTTRRRRLPKRFGAWPGWSWWDSRSIRPGSPARHGRTTWRPSGRRCCCYREPATRLRTWN